MESKRKETPPVKAQEPPQSSAHSSVHNSAHNPEFTNSKFPPLTELEKDSLVERNPSAESAHMLGHRLLEAAENGDAKEVLNLIRQGADANVRTYNSSSVPVLQLAADKGHTKVCKVLVENGADVNARDPFGQTVLMGAAFNGHVGAVRFLLSVGANPFLKDNEGKTAYYFALLSNSTTFFPIFPVFSRIIMDIILDHYARLWKKIDTFGTVVHGKHYRTPDEFKAALEHYKKLSSNIYPQVRNCSPDSINEIFTNL